MSLVWHGWSSNLCFDASAQKKIQVQFAILPCDSQKHHIPPKTSNNTNVIQIAMWTMSNQHLYSKGYSFGMLHCWNNPRWIPMCYLSLWLCLIGITGVALLPVQATLPPQELEAVRDLFLAAHGYPWNETEDPCTFWNQIHCEKNHVTKLELRDDYQQTSLPESIGNLQLLSVLDVSYNQLRSLPESIGKLQALSKLHVSHNNLTSLPESIGSFQDLSELLVASNQLNSLPQSIGKLQKHHCLSRLPSCNPFYTVVCVPQQPDITARVHWKLAIA